MAAKFRRAWRQASHQLNQMLDGQGALERLALPPLPVERPGVTDRVVVRSNRRAYLRAERRDGLPGRPLVHMLVRVDVRRISGASVA